VRALQIIGPPLAGRQRRAAGARVRQCSWCRGVFLSNGAARGHVARRATSCPVQFERDAGRMLVSLYLGAGFAHAGSRPEWCHTSPDLWYAGGMLVVCWWYAGMRAPSCSLTPEAALLEVLAAHPTAHHLTPRRAAPGSATGGSAVYRRGLLFLL